MPSRATIKFFSSPQGVLVAESVADGVVGSTFTSHHSDAVSAFLDGIKAGDSVADTVIGAGGAHPNEPAGMSLITERSFNAASEEGWLTDGAPTIVTDSSAPMSPNNVGRFRYTARTVPAGQSLTPGNAFSPLFASGKTEWYVHFAFMLSSGWQGHSSGVNKIIFISRTGASGRPGYYDAEGTGSNNLRFEYHNQELGLARNVVPNQSNGRINRGVWYVVEVHHKMNTGGNADGELHIWLNGANSHQYTDIQYVNAGDPHDFQSLTWLPIWGGTNDTLNNTQDMFMDHIYVSGK